MKSHSGLAQVLQERLGVDAKGCVAGAEVQRGMVGDGKGVLLSLGADRRETRLAAVEHYKGAYQNISR